MKKLKEMGVSVLLHTSIRITKKEYGDFDHIIAMDTSNLINFDRILNGYLEKKIRKLLSFVGKDDDITDHWYTLETLTQTTISQFIDI